MAWCRRRSGQEGFRETSREPTVFKVEPVLIFPSELQTLVCDSPACHKTMVTSLLSNPARPSTTRQSGLPLAPEFRLLGLRQREARLEVIRDALKETASELKPAEDAIDVAAGDIARVAVAGYRLLDPRRRATLFERVQLLLLSDEDTPSSTVGLWQAADAAAREHASPSARAIVDEPGLGNTLGSAMGDVIATLVSDPPRAVVARKVVASADSPQDAETRAALELFRSMRSRDRRAMALWISISALTISLLSTMALVVALV